MLKVKPSSRRPSPEEMALIVQKVAERKRAREAFVEKHGHMRIPIVSKAGGKMWSVIGGAIYRQTAEGEYNFINVIHDHGLNLFGIPRLEAEEEKPFEARHPALQWMAIWTEATQRQDEGRVAERIGAGAAWLRFCYDLFTIRDNAKLERLLKERLLSPSDFQGARHELWVAALCISAGFDIEFEDESDNSRTHPEFIAVDRFSNCKIAIEAKSRHRHGVHGFKLGARIPPGEKVDIRNLILDAYRKVTDLPFYVFIDVNLPPASQEIWDGWMAEIHQTVCDLENEGYADQCAANAVFFKNDPSHYLLRDEVGNESDQLWIQYFYFTDPRNAAPSVPVLDRLMKAHDQRAMPPEDIPQ